MNDIEQRIGEIQRQIWNEAYIKSKPIKWSFKVWFRCSSKVGYLYQIYLGRKQTPETESWGRSSSPADKRLGAILLHRLF